MNWLAILAAFINGVLVYLIVQALLLIKPLVLENWSWAWTLAGAVVGVILVPLQNFLTGLLGVPIDLSPILGVFSGVTAVLLTMHSGNVRKIKELRVKAGLEK